MKLLNIKIMAKNFEELTENEFNLLKANGLLQSIYPETPKVWEKQKEIKKDNDYYNKKKEALISLIPDYLSDLFFFDRKECEEISDDEVDYLFENDLISKAELVNAFSKAIDDLFD